MLLCTVIKRHSAKNVQFVTSLKCAKSENVQNEKGENANHDQNSPSARGVHFSALKPGPVVPPGTQKTPDQAARISQSAVFGHLSDILAFLRGGHFFHYFCHFFTF